VIVFTKDMVSLLDEMGLLSMENSMVSYLFTPTGQYPPLPKDQLILVSCVFTAIFALVSFVSYNMFKSDRKKMAWCISLFNSFVSTCFGCYYLAVNIKRHDHFFGYGADPNLIFYSVAPIENIICIWFAVACIVDVVFGVICYPKYLDPLSGWIHHIVYIWMMYFSCTGDGIFVRDKPFASAFVYMVIEEFPTFLLALGSVVPKMRVNMRFGLSFFILRILYHAYIVSWAYVSKFHFPGMCLYYLTLVMHGNWMIGWVKQQLKRRSKIEHNKKTA